MACEDDNLIHTDVLATTSKLMSSCLRRSRGGTEFRCELFVLFVCLALQTTCILRARHKDGCREAVCVLTTRLCTERCVNWCMLARLVYNMRYVGTCCMIGGANLMYDAGLRYYKFKSTKK